MQERAGLKRVVCSEHLDPALPEGARAGLCGLLAESSTAQAAFGLCCPCKDVCHRNVVYWSGGLPGSIFTYLCDTARHNTDQATREERRSLAAQGLNGRSALSVPEATDCELSN